jgi:hypothetical protein
MSPAHMSPPVAVRIVLVKQMVFTIEIDKTIGIVCPVFCRREMKPGPVFFFVQIILSNDYCQGENE